MRRDGRRNAELNEATRRRTALEARAHLDRVRSERENLSDALAHGRAAASARNRSGQLRRSWPALRHCEQCITRRAAGAAGAAGGSARGWCSTTAARMTRVRASGASGSSARSMRTCAMRSRTPRAMTSARSRAHRAVASRILLSRLCMGRKTYHAAEPRKPAAARARAGGGRIACNSDRGL